MTGYILKRIALIFPTLLGIMLCNFVLIQAAPGGPIESLMARMSGEGEAFSTFAGGEKDTMISENPQSMNYRGRQGLDPEFLASLEKQFGFDKPWYERFGQTLWNYMRLDFGTSYFRDISVLRLIGEKLPVSLSLGLWSTLLVYLIGVPLGIRRMVKVGAPFDMLSGLFVTLCYAVPGFIFAILLIVLFAGGSFWNIFPLRGLTSPYWSTLSLWGQIVDYFWHITLPVFAMTIGSFATLSLLTRNTFLEEIGNQYVITARARGQTERGVLYKHVFRNAMLVVVAGFPAVFLASFFSGALLIETLFSLDGLGLLSYEALVSRDYPVIFASLYIFGFMGLFLSLFSDLMYTWIDPRITFQKQEE